MLQPSQSAFRNLPLGTLLEVHYQEDGHQKMMYGAMKDCYREENNGPFQLHIVVDLTSTSSVGRRKEEWIFDFEEITGWRCIGPDYSSIQLLNKLENQGSLEEVEVRIQGKEIYRGSFISFRNNELCIFVDGEYLFFNITLISELSKVVH